MKLFLDDERAIPNSSWTLVRTAAEAVAALERSGEKLTHVSLDHDLGEGVPTGYHVVCELERLYYEGKINPDVLVTIHSANPSGAARMALACAKMFGKSQSHFLVNYMALCQREQRCG